MMEKVQMILQNYIFINNTYFLCVDTLRLSTRKGSHALSQAQAVMVVHKAVVMNNDLIYLAGFTKYLQILIFVHIYVRIFERATPRFTT